MFEKILLPLDGSELAEQVFPHMETLARAFNSEVLLVAVCEPADTSKGQTCRLYLNREAQELRRLLAGKSFQMQKVVLEGNAADEILKYARDAGATIIALTSHGRGGVKTWPPGGTVNRLLHESFPLLVVRAGEQAMKDSVFARILVPLDGSESGALALAPVVELSQKMPCEVTLLQVAQRERHVHTIGGLDYVPYLDTDLDDKKAAAAQYLAGVAAQLENTRATVKTVVRLGSPAEEILKLAAEMDATLIALTSHAHSALEKWFHDSVTQNVLKAAWRSFLLVPNRRED